MSYKILHAHLMGKKQGIRENFRQTYLLLNEAKQSVRLYCIIMMQN